MVCDWLVFFDRLAIRPLRRVLFEVFLVQFQPSVGERLRFADLRFDFLSKLFGKTAGIGSGDFEIPLAIGIQRVDGEIRTADIRGIQRLVALRMMENIAFGMIRVGSCGIVIVSAGPLRLPNLHLNAGFPLKFQQFPECFGRVEIIERRRDDSTGLMVIVVGEIKEILLKHLQRVLADERDGHVEILTALQFVLDGVFHGPTVMVGDQRRLVLCVDIVLFVDETG